MYDVVALGELLIGFASKGADSAGYPTMAANPGGIPSIPAQSVVFACMETL